MNMEFNIRHINDSSNDTVTFVVEGSLELTEWEIEWLKTVWARKKPYPPVGHEYIPVRNHGRTAMMKFIDEWTEKWEENPPHLELTPEKLAEIRTDVLNALERNTLRYYRYDDFGNLTDELVIPYVPPSNPFFSDKDEE